jgi:hypothetical protein
MKKIDYFFPQNSAVITGVNFVSLCVAEMQGKIEPGYEWVFNASACAFAASVLWVFGCFLLEFLE